MNIATIKNYFTFLLISFTSVAFANPPQKYTFSINGQPHDSVTAGWLEQKSKQTDKPDDEDKQKTDTTEGATKGAVPPPEPSLIVMVWTVEKPEQPDKKTDDTGDKPEKPMAYTRKDADADPDQVPQGLTVPLLVDADGHEFIHLDGLVQNVFTVVGEAPVKGVELGQGEKTETLRLLNNLLTEGKYKDKKAVIPFDLTTPQGPLNVSVTGVAMHGENKFKLSLVGTDEQEEDFTGHIIYGRDGTINELEIFWKGNQYTFHKLIPAQPGEVTDEQKELEKEAVDDSIMKVDKDPKEDEDDDSKRGRGPMLGRQTSHIHESNKGGSEGGNNSGTSDSEGDSENAQTSSQGGTMVTTRYLEESENATITSSVRNRADLSSHSEANKVMQSAFKEQSVY